MAFRNKEKAREYGRKWRSKQPKRIHICIMCGNEFVLHGKVGPFKTCSTECGEVHRKTRQKKWRAQNIDHLKEYDRVRNIAIGEVKRLARKLKFEMEPSLKERHLEMNRARSNARYSNDIEFREKAKRRSAKYYESNKGKCYLYTIQWVLKNPVRRKESARKYEVIRRIHISALKQQGVIIEGKRGETIHLKALREQGVNTRVMP